MSDHDNFDPAMARHGKAIMMTIDEWLNPDPENKKIGIAILMFPFGDDPDGRMNYMSNASRPEMIKAMKELLANMEGAAAGKGPVN